MKKPNEEQMKILLQAAVAMTNIQDMLDDDSITMAYDTWSYVDKIRKSYPDLKAVHIEI